MKNRIPILASCLFCLYFNSNGMSNSDNIIIIMADDLGYGDLSCYGGWIQTPQIDRLANRGLRFTDFHSNGAVCSPTRAALVTGKYQQRVGIPSVIKADPKADTHKNGIQSQHLTFAETLRDSGFRTAVFGKWHLGYYRPHNPTNHGFQVFRGYVSGNIDFFSHIDQAGKHDWWIDQRNQDETGYVTHLITDHTIEFIKQNKDRPFCCYVAHEAPHYPYQGPNDSADRKVNGKFSNQGSRTDKKEAYREMVIEMDKGIGKIMDTLDQLSLTQRTFVFFMSDNGANQQGSNGKLRGHKGSIWEGGHRVPAIAAMPGRIRAGISHDTVMSMDLAPTMLSISGSRIPSEYEFDGISLESVLFKNHSLPSRNLFWDIGKASAMRAEQWKLVKHVRDKKPQLFNLSTDLRESQDVALEHPQIVASLVKKLDYWRASWSN